MIIKISLLHQIHFDIRYNNKRGFKKYSHNVIILQDYGYKLNSTCIP